MKRAHVLSPLAVLVSALPAVLACETPAPVAPSSATSAPPLLAAQAPASAALPTPPAPVVDRDFLRLYTESRGFSRGAPRGATLTPDGGAVVFLRSEARDPKQSLYEMDVATGAVRLVLAPESLDRGPEHLTAEERARRERMRVTANGFTAFELSKDGKTVVVSLSGRLYALDRASGKAHLIETQAAGRGAVIDPHLSPDGKRVAYVQDDDVHVAAVDGHGKPRALTRGGKPDRPHGLADFAASEELDRYRGFWWSPDSQSILYEEADASALEHFTIADPGHPDQPADRVPYPRAGTVNAVLRLGIVNVASPGATTWVDWDREKMPYVPAVMWTEGAPPCLTVVDRLQKNEALLVVDPKTGKTREAMREHDDAWLNTEGSGQVQWLKDGSAFLWWSERDGDGRVGLVPARDASGVKWLTPPGTQVTEILDVDPARRVVTLETTRDGLHYELTRVSLDGGEPTTLAKLDDGVVHGSFDESHDVLLTHESSLSGVHRVMVRSVDGKIAREVPSVAAPAPVTHVEMEDVGPDPMHVALVRPHGYVPGARYPLIDSAYGGPHAQVVALDDRGMLFEQWMADATGAIVFSVDAKGTPGRGRAWERALAGKLGDVPLDGHVQAVKALVAAHPEIDGARVGIYGWSFGGYFSSLAVLRRPDVFTAAVAIAPVTDWHNYDTAYTERYLGLPPEQKAAYDASSVVVAAATPPAPGPQPTLLIAHGTADDNVYFFNSLQLVDALAKSGRSFRFLPFMGQTHQFASPEAQAAVWSAAAETLQRGLGTAR